MSRKQLASVINRALFIARSQSSPASTTATIPASFFANRNLHHHHRFFEEQENNNNARRRGTFFLSLLANKFRTKDISMRAFARLDRRFVRRVALVRAYFHFCPLNGVVVRKKRTLSPLSSKTQTDAHAFSLSFFLSFFSRTQNQKGYASDAAVSTSGSSGDGSVVPVNSGAILNALKTPNSEPNYAQENHRVDKIGDPDKRAFTYFVLTGGRMIYASAIRLAVLKFLMSMSASADVLALASLEVDLSKIQPGTTTTVKWRGKPVFIRRRTPDEIARENAVNVAELRDQQSDADRTQNPEWLVVVGVCTHLGCVPIANAGDYNGWFCPCHGSHYDASGRIRKGPAPENLEVPEYSFSDETTMVVG
jgi:ubiquinol-cytochrome c reductase iron-sulfur subunit